MESIELLEKVVKKREIHSDTYRKLTGILQTYDRVVRDGLQIIPFLEKYNLSKEDKMIMDFYRYTQKHLWDTVAILASRDNLVKTQLIENKVVNELCDTILTPKYFGTEDNERFNELLDYIKDAIKTHYKVCVWSDEKNENV